MIETTNPEINVNELMERVRRLAAEVVSPAVPRTLARARVDRALLPPLREVPDAPQVVLPPPIEWNKRWVDELLRKTRSKIVVASWIPSIFRRFFQRQGGFNRGVLETINFLAEMFEQLDMRVRHLSAAAEVQNQWLHDLVQQRQVEATWMKAVHDRFRQFADLRAEMDRHGEHLRNLQGTAE